MNNPEVMDYLSKNNWVIVENISRWKFLKELESFGELSSIRSRINEFEEWFKSNDCGNYLKVKDVNSEAQAVAKEFGGEVVQW